MSRLAAAFLVLALSATRVQPAEPPELTRREKGDLAISARSILKKYCHECHSGVAMAASRGTLRVLDHAKLVATGPNPVPFVVPGNSAASQLLQFLEDGSMPPAGRPRPKPAAIESLRAWVATGAPGYPAAFDDAGTLRAMLADLAVQKAEDVPFLRYFSFAHLLASETQTPNLKAAESALLKALAGCGVQTAPTPVDGTATLFRHDIRAANWDNRELFAFAPSGAGVKNAGGLASITPYDLLLLEYPHGFTLPPTDPLTKPLGEYLATAKLARPIPFLRADWLIDVLKRGEPLADDMKSLAELGESLKKQSFPKLGDERNVPSGPTTRPFAGRNPVPATPKLNAILPVLPLSAWYTGDCHTEPAPLAVTADIVDEDGVSVKSVAKGTPFRLRVTAKQDTHFVLLMVWADGTLIVQPTNKSGFLKEGETLLTPKDAEAFKITDVLTGEPQATEYFVLLASPTRLTTPLLVRSRHGTGPDAEKQKRFPVCRFILGDQPEGFDQSRVVRRVVPITVTAGKAE